jgi:hypothetical protein
MRYFLQQLDPRFLAYLVFGAGLLIWTIYKQIVPGKINAIFVAAILVLFTVTSSYLVVMSGFPVRVKIGLAIIDIILVYIFYWIFIKDGGENKKLLN